MSDFKEEPMKNEGDMDKNGLLPVLPLRDIVVFPHMIVPLFVGREKSVWALESVMNTPDKRVLLVTQKDASNDNPGFDDMYRVGTIGTVLQLLKLPDGTVKVLIEGKQRAGITSLADNGRYFQGVYELLNETSPESIENNNEIKALARALVSQFENYIKLNKKIPAEVINSVNQIDDFEKLADMVSAHMNFKITEKQEVLEAVSLKDRLTLLYRHMEGEIDVLNVEKNIRKRVKTQMEKTQRDYYLNEQIKAIQKELGEEDQFDELKEIEEKLQKMKMSKEAREKGLKELKKLKGMSPMSAESTVVRNYLDWITSIPWSKRTKVNQSITQAEKILNADHYGLEKVKERILEYLAVQGRSKKVKGSILCLVGAPGVGKTSLGQSIARATGRNFVRISLGGVHDESEIRGHRRTYIGAMPGKIVQSMKKAKSSNPVMLLDEIDKLGSDFRGDPSAALLEVLDPEQNNTFNDHYLDVDYDLSDVMFICTANTLNIPKPLMDRMEIIRISGYTEDEKVEIAKRHLIKKLMENNGLKKDELSVSDAALYDIVRYYTRESGVRSMEREIANLCRKAIKEIMMGKKDAIKITPKNLEKYAGVRKYRFGLAEEKDQVGVVTGLAWTEVGGELLTIEAVTVVGEGKVTMTGKLGDVMKESITAAEMMIKSRIGDFGIHPDILKKKNIHIHVPEGATPKDGPSAGCAMVTSIVSVLTGIPVHKDVAMTGEITLRGNVLPIGGLKEKLLAALRGGIKKVLLPIDNVKDLAEIPDNVKKGLELIPVSTVDDVLLHALVEKTDPIAAISVEIGEKTAENLQNDMIHH